MLARYHQNLCNVEGERVLKVQRKCPLVIKQHILQAALLSVHRQNGHVCRLDADSDKLVQVITTKSSHLNSHHHWTSYREIMTITSSRSVHVFKSRLETFLFNCPSNVVWSSESTSASTDWWRYINVLLSLLLLLLLLLSVNYDRVYRTHVQIKMTFSDVVQVRVIVLEKFKLPLQNYALLIQYFRRTKATTSHTSDEE